MAAITRPPLAMPNSTFNRLAGTELRAARLRAKCSQPQFAHELSKRLGVAVSPTSLAYYELGRTSVPAAVLLAAIATTKILRHQPPIGGPINPS